VRDERRAFRRDGGSSLERQEERVPCVGSERGANSVLRPIAGLLSTEEGALAG
jgi:hypothetical protein